MFQILATFFCVADWRVCTSVASILGGTREGDRPPPFSSHITKGQLYERHSKFECTQLTDLSTLNANSVA